MNNGDLPSRNRGIFSMKGLIAGFEGIDNSAKILLDNIKRENNIDILYLVNDFEISGQQIEEALLKSYDYILIFGQKPNTKNIYLEKSATLRDFKLVTNFNYDDLKEDLEQYYNVLFSCDAGKYLCNNVFFRALDFKQKNYLKSKIAFIHIPTIDNIQNIDILAGVILNYIRKY